ncbi:MAG: hypothetical protein EKK55_06995 [Rhodocyclaceae bacterium]|nr:MAG: hypothetical protein EKK55_06995 [Rhodocyclaceae bacterium]
MSGRRVMPVMNYDRASVELRRAVGLAREFGLAPVDVASTAGDPRETVPGAREFAAELRRCQHHFAMDAAADLHLDTLTPDEGTLKRARFAAKVAGILKLAADLAREHAAELEEAVDDAIRAALAESTDD